MPNWENRRYFGYYKRGRFHSGNLVMKLWDKGIVNWHRKLPLPAGANGEPLLQPAVHHLCPPEQDSRSHRLWAVTSVEWNQLTCQSWRLPIVSLSHPRPMAASWLEALPGTERLLCAPARYNLMLPEVHGKPVSTGSAASEGVCPSRTKGHRDVWKDRSMRSCSRRYLDTPALCSIRVIFKSSPNHYNHTDR